MRGGSAAAEGCSREEVVSSVDKVRLRTRRGCAFVRLSCVVLGRWGAIGASAAKESEPMNM